MRYRKLSATGDYSFGNNQFDFHRNTPELVGQKVVTRLKLWLNEWFLDVEEGTAWVQGVLGKQPLSSADTVLRARILETEGVVALTAYESAIDPDTRKLSVSATIDTIYGEAFIEVGI